MNKSLIHYWLLIVGGCAGCGIVNAAEDDIGLGLDLGVSIAQSSMYIDEVGATDFSSGTALVIKGSISLDRLLPANGFSIEGEYSKSMAPISYEFNDNTMQQNEILFTDTLTRNFNHQALGGYIAFDFLSTQTVKLKTRIGYVYSKATDETNITCSGACDERTKPLVTIGGLNAVASSTSPTGGGFSLGLNLSYAFLKYAYAAVEFTRLKITYPNQAGEYGITYVGVGVGMRL